MKKIIALLLALTMCSDHVLCTVRLRQNHHR